MNSTRSQLYWNTLLRIPVQIFGFVISIIITRILMPKDFGIMAIVMMLIGYSNLLTNFGLSEAIIQKNIKDKNILNTIFTFDLAISGILAGGFYATAGYISVFFEMPECESVIKVMSVIFLVTSFNVLPVAILRRDMNFKAVSILELIKVVLMSITTLILALNDYEYWSLVYGQLLANSITTVLVCVKAKWIPKLYFNFELFRDVYNFGMWAFLRAQILFIGQHVDRFIIGKWFDAPSLGFYDKAITLSRTPYDSITKNINSVMYSSFSLAQSNLEELRDKFRKSMLIIGYINCPLYIGLFVIAPYFVSSLLGAKWEPMIIPFQVIITGYLLTSFIGMQASINVGVGRYKAFTIVMFISLLIFIISSALLISYGIVGIAVSFVIFCFAQFILSINLTLANLKMKWSYIIASILPPVIPSIIMGVILTFMSKSYFIEHSVFNMVSLIIIGAGLFGVYVIFDQNTHVQELKRQMWNDIRGVIN